MIVERLKCVGLRTRTEYLGKAWDNIAVSNSLIRAFTRCAPATSRLAWLLYVGHVEELSNVRQKPAHHCIIETSTFFDRTNIVIGAQHKLVRL